MDKVLTVHVELLADYRFDFCIIDVYCSTNLTYYDGQSTETGEFVIGDPPFLWTSKAEFQCQTGQKFVNASGQFDNQTIECLWGDQWSDPLLDCECTLCYINGGRTNLLRC